jgi:hypothetical protein
LGVRWTQWGSVRRSVTASVAMLAGALVAAGPASSLNSGHSLDAGSRSGIALHVVPFPGTPDATPVSQVIFSSLRAGDLRSVKVTGSRSGRHRGKLVALGHGAGVAFDPGRRFWPGELVRVTAALRSPADGALSGDPGASTLRFQFRIGAGRRTTPRAVRSAATGRPPAPGPARLQSFHSEPDLHPPIVKFTGHLDARSGDVFVTAQNAAQPGPMILDPKGRLVWFAPVSRGEPMNLQAQRYQGQPVLTWWVGKFRNWGQDMILSDSYKTLAVIHGANGLNADLHEFQITRQGTALIDAYKETKTDLSSVGGPRHGYALDCIIQELDIRTGRLLWEWHALGHVPLSASHAPVTNGSVPFDYFHLNSIQQLPDGNLIISARNTWAVYEVNRKTGKVMWTLGGKLSSFRMGPRTNFEWQHTARLSGDRLSVFDDGSAPQEEPQSSAKILRINQRAKTVSLVHRYTHSPSLSANSAGSTQVLPDGNVFVGWGPEPDFSEYAPSGQQIFNGVFVWGTATYRAFRFPWSGQPAAPPKIALVPTSDGGVTVYASWNGATEVQRWQVLDGTLPDQLTADGPPRSRTGFETPVHLSSRPPFVAVQAIGAGGKVLGTSDTESEPPVGG